MELLSPAGNLELALAAFDGGADAVYCGVAGAFNARMRAENFTFDSLGKLIRYSDTHGKRVYLTLNTLIKENELGSMFEVLCELDKLRPHAVIVQDAGVIHTVKKYFPALKLHGSTQMGIHNSAGVRCMEKLGLDRVILERQITMDELQKIANDSNIELEVFIHGSLCCSLSGRCLLSGFLYGQSGNRGRCKQPCRRRWQTPDGTGYFLSPGDLCGTSILDELRRIGIASLKIEGRLRSPDYVWKTARAYRLLLDSTPENRTEAVFEAEKLLNSALSRRKTLGFYDFPARTPLIDHSTSGIFGNPAATVDKVTRRGILVNTVSSLHLGDRLRLIPPGGGEGVTFSLIAMETPPGQKALKVHAKKRIFIPGKFTAAPGYQLLKIGENGFDFSRLAGNLPEIRFPLDMKIDFNAKNISVAVNGKKFFFSCDFAPAEKHPLQREAVEKCFSEALPEPWCAGRIEVKIEGNFFVPAAELKKIRREFWQQFTLTVEEKFSHHSQKMEEFFRETTSAQSAPRQVPEIPGLVIPGFIPENELSSWHQQIETAYARGVRSFSIEHWHGFELLKDYSDITIMTRFPLPVYNSRSAALVHELGADAAGAAPELESAAINTMRQHAPIAIIPAENQSPLLVTRIPLPEGKWLDEKGNCFSVRKENDLYSLFADGDKVEFGICE
ncbi:MAG: U32 family peptidase [Lentisphaerae bacterium]|nr:U32 family peptidase [Lentisphaerota bacterium]